MITMKKIKSAEFIKQLAEFYITDKDATIRSTAEKFNIGKSTVHRYFSRDLKNISKELYEKVCIKCQLNTNKVRENFIKLCVIKKKKGLLNKVKNILTRNKYE